MDFFFETGSNYATLNDKNHSDPSASAPECWD